MRFQAARSNKMAILLMLHKICKIIDDVTFYCCTTCFIMSDLYISLVEWSEMNRKIFIGIEKRKEKKSEKEREIKTSACSAGLRGRRAFRVEKSTILEMAFNDRRCRWNKTYSSAYKILSNMPI